jgi:enamine deaminase RidA (YjgF/YER057c/UK114 family)
MNHHPRRALITFACLLAISCGTELLAQKGGVLKVINVEGRSAGSMSSPGVLAGDTLYVAGQNGRSSDGSLPKEFSQEVSQSLRNVQGVLRAAGMDFGSVVWMHVYVTSLQDIAAMDDVYWRLIGNHPPARTVLVVANLPKGEKVQISCIAAANTLERKVIQPPGWPKGDHIDPAGIQAGEVLYMSAQDGTDRATGKISEDYGTEVKQALDNVATILKTASMSMANVVWVNPYLSSAEANAAGPSSTGPIGHNGQAQRPDASVMNKTYASYLELAILPGGERSRWRASPTTAIVFSAIAGSDLSKRRSIQIRNMKPSPTASPGVIYWDTYYMSGKSGFIPDQGIVTPEVTCSCGRRCETCWTIYRVQTWTFPTSCRRPSICGRCSIRIKWCPFMAPFSKGVFRLSPFCKTAST